MVFDVEPTFKYRGPKLSEKVKKGSKIERASVNYPVLKITKATPM